MVRSSRGVPLLWKCHFPRADMKRKCSTSWRTQSKAGKMWLCRNNWNRRGRRERRKKRKSRLSKRRRRQRGPSQLRKRRHRGKLKIRHSWARHCLWGISAMTLLKRISRNLWRNSERWSTHYCVRQRSCKEKMISKLRQTIKAQVLCSSETQKLLSNSLSYRDQLKKNWIRNARTSALKTKRKVMIKQRLERKVLPVSFLPN